MISKFLTICALLGVVSLKELYNRSTCDVQMYTSINFDKQVTKGREKGISVLHYFKESDGQSEAMSAEYKKFATDNKGIFRIGAVDCDEQPKICEKEKIETFPSYRVYPPFPIPAFDIKYEGKLEAKTLRAKAGKFINDKSIELTGGNHKTFVQEDVATPKVILFTESPKGTPFVFKALSEHFESTLQFGLVRKDQESLVKQYKIKSFPAMFVIKDGKPIKFDSKDGFTYDNMFEFVNVYSQIFIDPTNKENQGAAKPSAASKPWLQPAVPQLTSDSANDICLKKDGTLCIVMVAENAAALSKDFMAQMGKLSEAMESKISRGISFNFMWLDASEESAFASIFGLDSYPSVAVMNPGKRKRFLIHDGELTSDSVQSTLDKILSGDARFKAVKGNELPKLVSKYPQAE